MSNARHHYGYEVVIATLAAKRDVLQVRVELLEEALREYAEHSSWRCEHRPHFYMTEEARTHLPAGDCACGLDLTLRELGLHLDQQGGDR